MESSTMTRQGGGGRPNLEGFPRGESGDGNGESEVGYHTQASLPDEPTSAPGPRKAQKRANFKGNKATICRIMSNLTKKEPKNKANFGYDLTAAMRTSPLRPENKANFGFSPLPWRERGRGVEGWLGSTIAPQSWRRGSLDLEAQRQVVFQSRRA